MTTEMTRFDRRHPIDFVKRHQKGGQDAKIPQQARPEVAGSSRSTSGESGATPRSSTDPRPLR